MITKAAIKLLNIYPAQDKVITIKEPLSYQTNVLKNRIWYRGDPSELDQFFKQSAQDLVSQSRFWAAVPSENLNIRKIHSGLPAMMVERLADIVTEGLESIDLQKQNLNDFWNEISKDNNFNELISTSIIETLVTGDGAFKVSIDTDLTKYPVIEFFSGEKVSYTVKRGRVQEVIFYTSYSVDNKDYSLQETYGNGYIRYNLFSADGKEVSLNTIPDTTQLQDITFDGDFIMAVPLVFFKSQKFDNRGKSIFDSKSDSFDALDEVLSQWIDAIRDGRVVKYIPEDLIPKSPSTGEMIQPNSFDNRFIKINSSLAEESKNEIDMKQATINYEAYVNSYSSALDVCLQGIISPATLGIDLKKTDNAEAQREKEKTTLYTRSKLIDTLQKVLPQLIEIVLQVNDLVHETAPKEYEATVNFGEYASPSFDNVIDTVGKAKLNGVMSIEQCVEELYGDTWTDEEKAEEVARLKSEQGILDKKEPATNADAPPDEALQNGE